MRKNIVAVLFVAIAAAFNAPTSRGDLIANWNFNTLTTATNNGTSYTPSNGTGSLTVTVAASDQAGNNRGIYSFAGTTVNAFGGAVAGQALTVQGGASESTTPVQNNGASILIQVDLTTYTNPILTYATQKSGASGFNSVQVAYSTNGSSFTDFGSAYDPATSFALKTFDFSAIPALDLAPAAYFRITFAGATANAGNNRIDNVQLNATPAAVPEASAFLFGGLICGAAGVWSWRRRNDCNLMERD